MLRLLIIGCGDIGLRFATLYRSRFRTYGLVRRPDQAERLRSLGIVPVDGDLDCRDRLGRLAGIADWVLHLAPPPSAGPGDPRTRNLLSALARRRIVPRRLSYISTSGVYGDCGGAWVKETRPPRPETARARRRLHAERSVRTFGRRNRVRVSILRTPGIYARDRLPVERLRAGTPALRPEDDVYTNHIHADDLARIALFALARGGSCRIYHATDGHPLKMGDYFDRVAAATGLPKPPRVSLAEARAGLSATRLSFMEESRRLDNRRMLMELRVRLGYPSPESALGTEQKS
jgi:nucleoside-diphosphate-sugar epimerase